MTHSSPTSVQLCDEVFGSSEDDSFLFADVKPLRLDTLKLDTLKLNTPPSQPHPQSTQLSLGITPSQIDPLYEFSQVPEEDIGGYEDEEEEEDEEGEEENYLAFNTQMTDLKDADDEFNGTAETNSTRHLEDPVHYGTDGYVRCKIPEIASSTDPLIAIELIQRAKKIVIVSGAGISVSAGIPDFRSEGRGLYALLASFVSGERSAEAVAFFSGLKEWQLEALQRLDEPESLFDLEFFVHDPHPFYSFLLATRFGAPSSARFRPTPSHHVIAAMPNLLLSFTQNIDTLEAAAGLAQVCYCHGSFEGVSCIKCHRPHDVEYFWKLLEMYAETKDVREGISFLPICQYCCDSDSDSDGAGDDSLPLLKPDIVFFGESLPANFFAHIRSTLPACDLLIVTGSSMKVLPVASIPDLIPPTTPQILVNKEPILDHNFDLELIGEADSIWSWIGKESMYPKCQDEILKDNFAIDSCGNGRFIFNK